MTMLSVSFYLCFLICTQCDSVKEPFPDKLSFELSRGGQIIVTGKAATLINEELTKYYNSHLCNLEVDTTIAFHPNYDGNDPLPPLVSTDTLSYGNGSLPFGLIRYDHPINYEKPFIELKIGIIYHKNRNLKGMDQLEYEYLDLFFALNLELNEVLSYGANSIGLPDTFPVKTDMFPGVGGQSK